MTPDVDQVTHNNEPIETLGFGQTDATFCRNIVQHCWRLLRLVAFFSDETGQTDATIERSMSMLLITCVIIMTILCYIYGVINKVNHLYGEYKV